MDGILTRGGFGCTPKQNRDGAREVLARGLAMAAERRRGRKGLGWQENQRGGETMCLPVTKQSK